MHSKLALFEGMSPEQKGALIGSLLGAGVGGLGGAFGSKKDKLRNSILAALAGGAGGAGLGFLGGRYLGYPGPSPTSDAVGAVSGLVTRGPIAGLPGAIAAGVKNAPAAATAIQEKVKDFANPLWREMGEEANSGSLGLKNIKGYDPGSTRMPVNDAAGIAAGLLTPPGAGPLGTLPFIESASAVTP